MDGITMPKFSIIVGMYNQRETLPMLIESLHKQTFQDFEVHFCDDGSDDESQNLIQGFLGSQFPTDAPIKERYFYHRQEHKGMRLSKNINQGIKSAKGQYCVFVMADSMLETDYLEILNEWVSPERLIVGVRIQLAKVNGNFEGVDMDWRVKKGLVPQFPSVILAYPWLCLTGNGMTIPTDALREYGGWWEELEGYGGDDNELIARLYFKGYMCWSVPDLRLYHHWHISKESNQINSRKVVEKIKEYER